MPVIKRPRVKTYSAGSGFVYQYQFQSHEASPTGDRYRFQTTQDRRSSFDVTVVLSAAAIEAWESQEHRTLSPTERYALAKIALFTAFDDAERPESLPEPIVADADQVRAIAQLLDL